MLKKTFKYWRIFLFLYPIVFAVALLSLSKLEFTPHLEPSAFLSEEEIKRFGLDQADAPVAVVLLEEHTPLAKGTLENVSRTLEKNPNIEHVLHRETLSSLAKTRLSLPFFEISENQSLLVLQLAEPIKGLNESRAFNREVETVFSPYPEITASLVGDTRTRELAFAAYQRELVYLILPLTVALLVISGFALGSIVYATVPPIIAALVLTLSFAAYALWGTYFTYFSLTLVPLLCCLCLLDSIFLINAFQRQLVSRAVRQASFRAAKEVLRPALLTTLTTAIGFGSLYLVSGTPLLKEYGLFASLGILLSFLATFTLGPALLVLLPSRSKGNHRQQQWLGTRIARAGVFLQNYRKFIFATTLTLLVVFGILAYQVDFVGSHSKIFAHSDPYQQKIDILKSHLGSLIPLELTIQQRDNRKTTNARFLMYTETLRQWLIDEGLAKRAVAVTQLAKRRTIAKPKGNQTQIIERLSKNGFGFVKTNGRGKITQTKLLTWPLGDSFEAQQKFIRYLENFNATMMKEFEIQPAGGYFLKTLVERRLVKEAMTSFLVAALIVGLVLCITLYGKIPLWTVMLVNFFPVFAIVGLMAVLDFPFHIGLIGLPCILFGVCVDDTIHLAWGSRKGLENSLKHNAHAILVTSLLLGVCFAAHLFSNYAINRDFGLFGLIGISIAMLYDLFVLPALAKTKRTSNNGVFEFRKAS